MKKFGLRIDFPNLEGASTRQIWYAESLRETYIQANYERFEEIEQLSNLDSDERIRVDGGNYIEKYKDYTYCEILSEPEKACLLCKSAGGVIAILKRCRDENPENFEY